MTQKKRQAHPSFLCREREAARGGQVGGLALFGQFSDHGDSRFQRFFHGEEHVFRLGRAHEKKPRRRKPEEITAESIWRARFERGEILLHPDDGTVRQHSERKRKTRRSAVVKVALR